MPDECRYAESIMSKFVAFLLWCLLLVACWPVALLALILYPLVWLLLIPFRLMGIAVGGVLAFIKAIVFLPARVLRHKSK
jgi:hypothetical protein